MGGWACVDVRGEREREDEQGLDGGVFWASATAEE